MPRSRFFFRPSEAQFHTIIFKSEIGEALVNTYKDSSGRLLNRAPRSRRKIKAIEPVVKMFVLSGLGGIVFSLRPDDIGMRTETPQTLIP